jgi:hypothetical protein
MKRILLIAALLAAAAFSVFGQGSRPMTERSLFWTSDDPAVEITVIDRRAGFNLLVISENEVVVTYRTSVNSSQSVVKTLEPVKSEGCRKYYLVAHSFSKRTIWMALDFKIGSKDVPSLTRTFYNGLLEIVPNDQFDRVPK